MFTSASYEDCRGKLSMLLIQYAHNRAHIFAGYAEVLASQPGDGASGFPESCHRGG